MRILFHNAYFQSRMDYCCTIWGTNTKAIRTMSKLQHRMAKIIFQNEPNKHLIDSSYLDQWLSFEKRCVYSCAVLVYKNENGNTPPYINNLLCTSHNANYGLRSATKGNLIIPKFRSERFKKSFSYFSTKVWNKILIEIRNIHSLNKSKSELKRHLHQISNG